MRTHVDRRPVCFRFTLGRLMLLIAVFALACAILTPIFQFEHPDRTGAVLLTGLVSFVVFVVSFQVLLRPHPTRDWLVWILVCLPPGLCSVPPRCPVRMRDRVFHGKERLDRGLSGSRWFALLPFLIWPPDSFSDPEAVSELSSSLAAPGSRGRPRSDVRGATTQGLLVPVVRRSFLLLAQATVGTHTVGFAPWATIRRVAPRRETFYSMPGIELLPGFEVAS